MEEEVERHRTLRDSLEAELHDLRERLLMVESITEDLDSKSSDGELSENQFSWSIRPFTLFIIFFLVLDFVLTNFIEMIVL